MPGLMHGERGFSLIELIVALAISAILLGLALPSFRHLMGDSKISSATNDLVYALHTARSEAIKRAGPVGLCSSDTPLADTASCDGSGYADGWIVYIDENADGFRDATEDLVLQSPQLAPGFTIAASDTIGTQVWFNESGTSGNAAGIPLSGQIEIDWADGEETRTIAVSANGRIRSIAP